MSQQAETSNVKLSLIAPIYSAGAELPRFITEYHRLLTGLFDQDFEMILVVDGCTNNSYQKCLDAAANLKNIKIIDLAINYGQARALLYGLSQAQGEWCYICDGDNDEPSKILAEYWKEHELQPKYHLIGGFDNDQRRGFKRELASKLSWTLFSSSSKDRNQRITARLFSSDLKKVLLDIGQGPVYLNDLFDNAGFEQKYIKVEKFHHAETSYDFLKKFHLFSTGILLNKKLLQRAFVLISVVFSLFFLLMLGYILFSLLSGASVPGWLSLITVITMFFMFNFLGMALIFSLVHILSTELFGQNSVIVRKMYERR